MASRNTVSAGGIKHLCEDPIKPKVTDLDMFLPWACKQLSVETEVLVTRSTQEMYVPAAASKKRETSRRTISTLKTRISHTDDEHFDEENTDSEHEKAVKIKTVYDRSGNLVNIRFFKNTAIPRQVVQVIALTIPYNIHLTSITINSGLRMDTLYEISKFLPDSNITELCLDNTFLTQPNYHILLTHNKLKHLSLVSCSINDAGLKTITDQLEAASPASKALSALNLSRNKITDVGAKYVADMLRTNRQLCYLNLAGNRITDEGGMSILEILQKFPLGSQECLEYKARYLAYLKKRNKFIEKMIKELQGSKVKIPKKKNTWKGKVESRIQENLRRKSVFESRCEARAIHDKAEHLAETEMESFNGPYSPHNTESQRGDMYCLGNNSLCYLNLAYNKLTYVSVRKLHDVLLRQKSLNRTPRGLIKVVIEGNLMPVACKEYSEINQLLR